MSIDCFHGRVYSDRRYTCYHFAREVWLHLTGVDLAQRVAGLFGSVPLAKLQRAHVRAFAPLPGPVSPCLVVMQRHRAVPHVGVYVDGRVLHLTRQGVEFQPIHVAGCGFTRIRYVQCN